MKYLKIFELFDIHNIKDCENIMMDIRDILLELSDDGFSIAIDGDNRYTNYSILNKEEIKTSTIDVYFELSSINGQDSFKQFNWIDVKDTIFRLVDFLKSKGIKITALKLFLTGMRKKYNFDESNLEKMSQVKSDESLAMITIILEK